MQTETTNKRRRPSLPINRIMAAVAARLGSPTKRDKNAVSVEARHIAVFLCVDAGWSLAQVGIWLEQHHTTILHGYRNIKARLAEPDTSALLADIKQLAESSQALRPVPRVFQRKPPGRMHPDDLVKLAEMVADRLARRGAA